MMTRRIVVLVCTLAILVRSDAQATDPDRFEFVLHDGLTVRSVAHLEVALNEAYDEVLSRLGLKSLPTITVQVWKDEPAYQEAMEVSLGSRAPGSRGYAFGTQQLRLLYHTMPSAQREAVHEFAHVATLNVNPDFGNNPRWLWESVAVYLAGEFVDPASSGVFFDGTCPSTQNLNAPFDQGGAVYDAGFVSIEFIERNWGLQGVVELIRSEGALGATTGIPVKLFEKRWCEFVYDTYMGEARNRADSGYPPLDPARLALLPKRLRRN